jgi:hypothetical protein
LEIPVYDNFSSKFFMIKEMDVNYPGAGSLLMTYVAVFY